jgi:hypothetical protein
MSMLPVATTAWGVVTLVNAPATGLLGEPQNLLDFILQPRFDLHMPIRERTMMARVGVNLRGIHGHPCPA